LGLQPLGGPIVALGKPRNQPTVTSNAAVYAPTSGGAEAGQLGGLAEPEASEKATAPGQPPAVLGPTPYDLTAIKRLQVGSQSIAQAPLRVGNLDILSPFTQHLAILGATVSSADPKNVPGFTGGPSQAQHFQVNMTGRAPMVLTVGKDSAWINDETGFHEQKLRAAPLVIGEQIYLPVFSLAPLLGAAARLNDAGTLVLTPTIQSVQVFSIKDSAAIAVTIKTSAPVPPGGAKIVAVKGKPGSSPKVYVDFPGYSMGFDAGNSTIEQLVAPGAGDALRARAGMPSKFPDTTRIVLDLKKSLVGTRVALDAASAPAGNGADPTLFALVLAQPGKVVAAIPPPDFKNPPPLAVPKPQIPPNNSLASLPGLPSSLRGLTIVVDPGHGGHDPGAQRARSNEKSLTLDISLRLRKALQARGANVLMTRETDRFVSLQGRCDFANQRGADLFVSVHINASPKPGSSGTETFYYSATSQSFAREVHKELVKATGRPNRKIHQRRLWVVRHTWMPAILTETAFISNSKEEALLRDPNFRERVARGIAQGVSNYASIYMRSGLSG
jgi:N-acetylmuramoyl-L-alanine amidase